MFITISGLFFAKNTQGLIIQVVFLPVTVFFLYLIFLQLKQLGKKTTSNPVEPVFGTKKTATVSVLIFLVLFLVGWFNITNKPSDEAKKYLEATSKKPVTENLVIEIKNIPSDQAAYIYQEATTSAVIINRASGGEQYTQVSKKADWYEIMLDNNTTGWIDASFTTTSK